MTLLYDQEEELMNFQGPQLLPDVSDEIPYTFTFLIMRVCVCVCVHPSIS